MPLLGEKQSRLYLGAESQSTGWGGQTKIAELSGKSQFLIARGEKELQNPELQSDNNRMRHKGAGRKKEADKYPELVSAIRELVSRLGKYWLSSIKTMFGNAVPEVPLVRGCASHRLFLTGLTCRG